MNRVITDYSTIWNLAPHIALVICALGVIIGGAFTQARAAWAWLGILGFVVAGYLHSESHELAGAATAQLEQFTNQVVSGPLLIDELGRGMVWFGIFFGVLFLLGLLPAQRSPLFAETVGSLLFAFVGLMLVAFAGDLVLLFLGLELISIPTYVLLFLGRKDKASAEATAKYFYLSILSSALLLYGFSLLYGMAGTVSLIEMRQALAAGPSGFSDRLMSLALPLLLAGFGFKMAVAPFHFYAPDVYHATTNINAGLLAVVPKVAGIVAMIRVLVEAVPVSPPLVWQIVLVLAVVTMTVANVSGLWQKGFRRLLAYSSVANSGFLLMALSAALASDEALRSEAVAATLLYVVFYSLGTLGIFAALVYLDDEQTDFSHIRQLRGIGRRHPIVAAIIAICLFSLSGIPPLAGFWGKFFVFKSAIQVALAGGPNGVWFWTMIVCAAVNATIAAAYYLRVVGEMYFQPFEDVLQPRYLPPGSYGPSWAAFICTAAVLLLCSPGSTVERAYNAARQLGTASAPTQATGRNGLIGTGSVTDTGPSRGSTKAQIAVVSSIE
jgi:NADH-quinone oxidoreductase subunit N